MTSRLPQSKRNELIADYNAGIQDPEYEVIPSKTTKGRFTIRKRKTPIEEQEEEVPAIDQRKEVVDNGDDDEEEEIDEPRTGYPMYNSMAYLQEYQMMLNRMMIEQMKTLRQNNKYLKNKQKKYKDRQNKIRDIFQKVANMPDEEEVEEPEPVQVQEQETEEQSYQQPTSYFEESYVVPEQEQPQQVDVPIIPQPEPVQYQNDYEEQLDEMAEFSSVSSRRNRIKAFI